VTSFEAGWSHAEGHLDQPSLLPPEESLDDDELDLGPDETYSPADHARGLDAWGITEREAGVREDLAHRLAREESDLAVFLRGDGIGDVSDTDGEPIDDEVGDVRAGRLVFATFDPSDPGFDLWAFDIGVDGGGASAEEAAIHIIPYSDDS
jgi:hypothetical protein